VRENCTHGSEGGEVALPDPYHSSNGSPIEAFGEKVNAVCGREAALGYDDIEFSGKRNETLVILMRLP